MACAVIVETDEHITHRGKGALDGESGSTFAHVGGFAAS